MDDSTYNELKAQIDQQGKAIEEIRATQIKIANALLGSFDRNAIGLIEEQRILKRDVDIVKLTTEEHTTRISELLTFKTDIKKIVGIIAFTIPFAFEIIKGLGTLLWDYLRGGH